MVTLLRPRPWQCRPAVFACRRTALPSRPVVRLRW
jgi:hypothetical protein